METATPKPISKFWRLVRLVAFCLGLLILGGAGGYFLANSKLVAFRLLGTNPPAGIVEVVNKNSGPSTVDFSLFWEVWDKLHLDYLDATKLDNAKMVYGAIQGMTAAIGDPYTVFLPPTDNKRAKEDLNGAFEGVGIQLGYVDKQLAVMAPLEKHPAQKAGVKAGDLILHIKDVAKSVDKDTGGMSLPEAVEIIRGKKGTPVTLTILHEGENETKELTILRDSIVIPSVELQLGKIENGPIGSQGKQWVEDEQGGNVAWLRLYRFGDQTELQWNEAVNKILTIKSRVSDFAGVILDVRNNPGGFLTGSVYVASEFVRDGVVVQQQGKVRTETYEVDRVGKLIGTKLVMLVNKGSASASEIVAGALRDRLKAKLVGETTFGKGTVQEAEDLRSGAGIHITTARWLLPSGEWISEKGLKPDVEVKLDKPATDSGELVRQDGETKRDDAQLVKAVETLMAQ